MFLGYEGKWLNGINNANGRAHSDVLDNTYYQELFRGWRQVKLFSHHFTKVLTSIISAVSLIFKDHILILIPGQ